jgi:hypothetical protein
MRNVPALPAFIPDSLSHLPRVKPTADQITDNPETKQGHFFTLLFFHGFLLFLIVDNRYKPVSRATIFERIRAGIQCGRELISRYDSPFVRHDLPE